MVDGHGMIVDRAIDWHLRHPDMSGDEWREFLLWMEESPEHAQAFNALMFDESLLGMRYAALEKEGVRPVAPPTRRRLIWGGLAASALAAACAVVFVMPPKETKPAYYTIATEQGARRQLVLDDGTRIEMAGGTRMKFDRRDPRFAELIEGEARFQVRHNQHDPFALKVGEARLRDLGTIFNVQHDRRGMEVQVGEGAVLFEAAGGNVQLGAGKALSYANQSGTARTWSVDPAEVGEWRQGRLHFIDTPLSTVANALERHLGARLAVDPAIADMPFTGLVSLTGKVETDIAHFARLSGVTLLRSRKGWALTAGKHDPS